MCANTGSLGKAGGRSGRERVEKKKRMGLHHRILFRLIEAAQPVGIPTRLPAKRSGLPLAKEHICRRIRSEWKKKEITQRETETKSSVRTKKPARLRPPLPRSRGCSLITLLGLSARGWAHYPSTPALLLPETAPPFSSSAGALARHCSPPYYQNTRDNE